MSKNQEETSRKLKIALTIQVVLICIFLLVLSFGVSCIVSKYLSVKNGNIAAVFGKTTVIVQDDSNLPKLTIGDKLVLSLQNNVAIGDIVLIGETATSNNLYIVKKINRSSAVPVCEISKADNSNIQTISISSIIGKVTSTSPGEYKFYSFLLSDWILWLYVVAPCICIFILMCLYWLNISYRRKQLLLPPSSAEVKLIAYPEAGKAIEVKQVVLIEDSNTQKEKDFLDKVEESIEKDGDKKKSQDVIILGAEAEINSTTDTPTEQAEQKSVKQPKKAKERKAPILVDLEKQQKQKEQKSKPKAKTTTKKASNYKLNTHKKPTVDKRDDYVFQKNLSLDSATTTTPVQVQQSDNQREEAYPATNAQRLLDKMRRDSKK